jgi:hypothetical protein
VRGAIRDPQPCDATFESLAAFFRGIVANPPAKVPSLILYPSLFGMLSVSRTDPAWVLHNVEFGPMQLDHERSHQDDNQVAAAAGRVAEAAVERKAAHMKAAADAQRAANRSRGRKRPATRPADGKLPTLFRRHQHSNYSLCSSL